MCGKFSLRSPVFVVVTADPTLQDYWWVNGCVFRVEFFSENHKFVTADRLMS